MRLFTRLRFGSFQTYDEMRKEFNHLADHVPHNLCREWHVAIDTHGKYYRKNKKIDESWLFNQRIIRLSTNQK